MGNTNYPNNGTNQPPAGYIWPTGYYPMHGNNHSANLIGAELYIQGQQRKAQQREWAREHPWNWRTQWRFNLAVIAIFLLICGIAAIMSSITF